MRPSSWNWMVIADMYGIIFRKQLREMFSSAGISRRKGEVRSAKGRLMYKLFAAALVLCLGFAAFRLAENVGNLLLTPGFMGASAYDWVYYGIMCLVSCAAGVTGSIFSAYSGLYNPKDRTFLLSMPIEPKCVLFSRILSIYLWSVFYCAIVWIPAVLNYWFTKMPTVTGIVFPVLLGFIIPLTVVVISSLFAFIVAWISSRIKRKNLVALAASIAAFVGICSFCLNMKRYMYLVIEYALMLAEVKSPKMFILQKFGLAACGDPMAMVMYTGFCLSVFIICCWVLSLSYETIVTKDKGRVRAEFKEGLMRQAPLADALFKRELRSYFSCPACVLYTGIGVVLMPVLALICALKHEYFEAFAAFVCSFFRVIDFSVPVLLALSVCVLISIDCISAISVSLEGGNLWLIKTMPISFRLVIWGKLKVHVVLNGLASGVFVMVLAPALDLGFIASLEVLLLAEVFSVLTGCVGLVLNIKRPALIWTKEGAPSRQSLNIAAALSVNLLLCGLIFAGHLLTAAFLPARIYLAGLIAGLGLAAAGLLRWLRGQGSEEFGNI